jgi:hypothetical protein
MTRKNARYGFVFMAARKAGPRSGRKSYSARSSTGERNAVLVKPHATPEQRYFGFSG